MADAIDAELKARGDAIMFRYVYVQENYKGKWQEEVSLIPAAEAEAAKNGDYIEYVYARPPAPKVDEAMVERACELSWPVAKFGMEPSDWNQADPMRRSHHKRAVCAAITAALENHNV